MYAVSCVCFVYLFIYLFAFLQLAFANHTVDGAAYAARAATAYSRFAAQECVAAVAAVRAMVRRHQTRRAVPHKRTAPVGMRRGTPRRGECCAVSESSPRTNRHTDGPGCM